MSNGPDVFFRLDASSTIGGGHLGRSLVLAECLRKMGARIEFLSASLDGPYMDSLAAHAFPVKILDVAGEIKDDTSLSRDARASTAAITTQRRAAKRILVVDHYRISLPWESALRAVVDGIVVIDDLADRNHDCDLLLDQSYGEDGSRYADLIPPGCKGLYGTRYALLRPEFADWRVRRVGELPENDRDVIVHAFFGSEDVVANALRFPPLMLKVKGVSQVRVAVSPQFKYATELEALRQQYPGRLSWRVAGPNMAEHMAGCDIAVGSPGHATWERACLGLPAALIAIADNQVPILKRLAEEKFCFFLGVDRILGDDDFLTGFSRFVSDRNELAAMREKSLAMVDGLGSDRVAASVFALGSDL